MPEKDNPEAIGDNLVHAGIGHAGDPVSLLRNILNVAVFVFLGTKVVTADNINIFAGLLPDYNLYYLYITPLIAIGILTGVMMEYGKIIFAPSSASDHNGTKDARFTDITVLLFCLAALNCFTSSLQFVPHLNATIATATTQNTSKDLTDSIRLFSETISTNQVTQGGINSALWTHYKIIGDNLLNYIGDDAKSNRKFISQMYLGCLSSIVFFIIVIVRLYRTPGDAARRAVKYNEIGLIIVSFAAFACYKNQLPWTFGLTSAGAFALCVYKFRVN